MTQYIPDWIILGANCEDGQHARCRYQWIDTHHEFAAQCGCDCHATKPDWQPAPLEEPPPPKETL